MALVVLPKQLMVDGSGNPRSGAKAYFYQSGTTTPITVYTTSDYSVAHSNPVIANASGLFPAVYINPAVNSTYKLVVKDSSDVEIYSEDNIPALGFTQADVGATLYPRTAAEIAAGVTPSDYTYPELDVRRYGGSPANADNTSAFNAAIAVANLLRRCIVVAEAGTYTFTTPSPLTTMSGCLGIIGPSQGEAFLSFHHETDSIVAKGNYKRFENIYAKNTNTTARASRKAVIRIQNCAYGYFANVFVACGATNQVAIMLEQVYDGSEEDGYLLVHLGCWYNTFINCTAGYLSTGANVGDGLVFTVDSSARSVVNPTGQAAGTYTGSCAHNVVINLNSESFNNDVMLDGYCDSNLFMGGQLLGGQDQIRIVDGQHNRFIGVSLNQAASNPINVTGGRAARNYFDVFLQRHGQPMPWSFGTLSATDEVRHRGDGATMPQKFFAPIAVIDNDAAASQAGGIELTKHPDYDKNGVVIKTDTNPTGTKALLKIERGGDGVDLIRADINGTTPFAVTQLGRVVASTELQVPIVATANLPAAGASNNGLLLIEDPGAGSCNVVIYARGQRFRINGGAAF